MKRALVIVGCLLLASCGVGGKSNSNAADAPELAERRRR
jgi:hypothetical protein